MDCRFCQYYHFEGRRQGLCLRLGTPVSGGTPMCCLAVPAFAREVHLPLRLPQPEASREPVCLAAGVPLQLTQPRLQALALPLQGLGE